MLRRPLFRVAAAGVAAATALAFAPSLDLSLGDGVELPELVTAADLGLAYAPRLVQVDAPTLDARNAVVALGLDTTEHASNDYIEIVLSSAAEEQLLRDNGFEFEVEIPDLVLDDSLRAQRDALWAAAVGISAMPSGRTGYRSLEDFGAEIDALVAAHPDLAKRISIGESIEGRDLTGIEIGADVTAADDGRPVFLMFGVHHAREWPSAEIPMEFAYDLLQGYTDPTHDQHERIVDLLDRGRMIIVPVSNPDGYQTSRFHGDILDFDMGPAWWRKNCRYLDGIDQPEGTCQLLALGLGQTGIGVDLNRNYGGLWGGPGASALPADGTYRGSAPFSEPETQAIRDLISSRQVTTLITNHTRGQLLLRPVGVAPDTIGPDGNPAGFAPDECFTRADGVDYGMQALGERMTAQSDYTNQFGWELYDTTGTTEDYSYNATGGYGFTYELMPGGGSFHPDYATVVAEYTGTDEQSLALRELAGTPEGQAAAESNTTEGGDDCAGSQVEHDTLGGGLREAYLIAFENAVDARTHSVLTGLAPAGAEVTVSRTGDFPLWDGTFLQDTVTSTMTVAETGAFAFHVNPSTRPFVASRKLLDGSSTEGQVESWTVTCTVDGETSAPLDVVVDRGESVELGSLCPGDPITDGEDPGDGGDPGDGDGDGDGDPGDGDDDEGGKAGHGKSPAKGGTPPGRRP